MGSVPLIHIAVKAGQLEVVKYLVRDCKVAVDSDQMVMWLCVEAQR
jgi:hypothetical protein